MRRTMKVLTNITSVRRCKCLPRSGIFSLRTGDGGGACWRRLRYLQSEYFLGVDMNPFLYFVDSLSAWVGKAFGWCIMVLTFATCYEVFVRYVLNAPTAWAFDMAVQMYGALFMMAGAYTLSRNGHVRGDVIHRLLPIRVQAGIDLTLYILFLLPGVFALIWYGYEFAADSWRYKEVSWSSPARVQIYSSRP